MQLTVHGILLMASQQEMAALYHDDCDVQQGGSLQTVQVPHMSHSFIWLAVLLQLPASLTTLNFSTQMRV